MLIFHYVPQFHFPLANQFEDKGIKGIKENRKDDGPGDRNQKRLPYLLVEIAEKKDKNEQGNEIKSVHCHVCLTSGPQNPGGDRKIDHQTDEIGNGCDQWAACHCRVQPKSGQQERQKHAYHVCNNHY